MPYPHEATGDIIDRYGSIPRAWFREEAAAPAPFPLTNLRTQPEPLIWERVTLSPRGPEHAAALFDAFSDPLLWRFIPGDAPESIQTLEGRFARTKAGPLVASERWWNWVVARCDVPDAVFGTVELTLVDDGRRALLAYMFARRSWGRGYAFEACAAVLNYLRGETPGTSIEAFVDTRNHRSIALVERLGFQRRETIVGADHFKGSESDEYRYRLENS